MKSNGCKFSNPDKKCIERYIRSQAAILRHIWKDEEEHYYTDQVVQVIEKAALTMKTALEQLEEKDVKFTYSCMMALGKTFKEILETIERIKISNSGND